MPVLVLGATKGGVGKTTLAAALAVEASRKHKRVAIMDLDPQQSLARWHELRVADQGKSNTIELLEPGRAPDVAITRAVKEGLYEWLIIDTPPGGILRTEHAVAHADLVLIPTRPSPIDVESMDAIVELAKEHKVDYVFVLNATTKNSKMTDGARAYLKTRGDVLSLEIVNRQPYASAMIKGSSPAEAGSKSADAADELAQLWTAIGKRLASNSKLSSKKRVL